MSFLCLGEETLVTWCLSADHFDNLRNFLHASFLGICSLKLLTPQAVAGTPLLILRQKEIFMAQKPASAFKTTWKPAIGCSRNLEQPDFTVDIGMSWSIESYVTETNATCWYKDWPTKLWGSELWVPPCPDRVSFRRLASRKVSVLLFPTLQAPQKGLKFLTPEPVSSCCFFLLVSVTIWHIMIQYIMSFRHTLSLEQLTFEQNDPRCRATRI